jgi:phage-related protein
MTLNTFNPDPPPSPGTDIKRKPKLLKADFGDGYSQATRDGVNWIKNSLTLTWETLTLDQAVVIDTFFSDQGGDVPFYYTVSDDLAPTKWTCEDWSVKRGQGGLRTINATLTQNFSTLT